MGSKIKLLCSNWFIQCWEPSIYRNKTSTYLEMGDRERLEIGRCVYGRWCARSVWFGLVCGSSSVDLRRVIGRDALTDRCLTSITGALPSRQYVCLADWWGLREAQLCFSPERDTSPTTQIAVHTLHSIAYCVVVTVKLSATNVTGNLHALLLLPLTTNAIYCTRPRLQKFTMLHP